MLTKIYGILFIKYKKNIWILKYLFFLSLIACTRGDWVDQSTSIPDYTSFEVSDIKPSLISEDHTSEGILMTMPNGRILHFFRLDKGIDGNHTSNESAIYKRYSDDNALTWSIPELVYDTPGLDDRNIGGGIIDSQYNGTGIILIFRTFKATSSWGAGKHMDTGYIISWDEGKTFSERHLIDNLKNSVPMLLTPLSDREYIIPFYEKNVDIKKLSIDRNEIIFEDVQSFDQEEWMKNLSEPAIINQNGNISIVFRNNKNPGVYLSTLRGDSKFSLPAKTNMIEENRISLPLFFYDSIYTNKYWFIAGDRPYNNKENAKLWIYSNEDLNSPFIYEYAIERPLPNEWQFYGYPTITLMKNGKYLIIFTESYLDYENNENANFYQFTLTPKVN